MGMLARMFRREERAAPNPLENPTISIGASYDEFMQFFGQMDPSRVQLPPVTIESALKVPAVLAAVGFLSRTLAALPLHAYRKAEGGAAARADGELQMLLNEAPNEEWSSFGWRRYMWEQVFTGGRGTTWIERRGVAPVALWPMDPDETTVLRRNGRRFYRFGQNEYPASDVIDVTFMLRRNQISHRGPIAEGKEAIGLAIAMGNFAAQFFGSGGLPPLSLEGPLPQGPDGFKRAMKDIWRAVDQARKAGQPFFGLPPGHKLAPVGIDPDKGQMVEAQLFQIQQLARIWNLPPVFLQDLSKGTFSNTEQQDLQLVKHVIGQWSKAFEDELNLKLFGQRRRSRYVEHSLDGLQRGDFKSRIEGLARAIQTGQLMPDEARALENRPPDPNGQGGKLYIQGATVPLGTTPPPTGHDGGPAKNDNGDPADDDAGEQKGG